MGRADINWRDLNEHLIKPLRKNWFLLLVLAIAYFNLLFTIAPHEILTLQSFEELIEIRELTRPFILTGVLLPVLLAAFLLLRRLWNKHALKRRQQARFIVFTMLAFALACTNAAFLDVQYHVADTLTLNDGRTYSIITWANGAAVGYVVYQYDANIQRQRAIKRDDWNDPLLYQSGGDDQYIGMIIPHEITDPAMLSFSLTLTPDETHIAILLAADVVGQFEV